MRRLNRLIFDEVIGTQTAGIDVFYYTSQTLNNLLGQYDQIGLQAMADDVTGSNTLWVEIRLETSCDGRSWVAKNSSPEIPLTAVSAAGVTLLPYGKDDGARPNYAFVRCVIRLSSRGVGAGPGSVRLRIYVTARDQGGVIHRALSASQYHPVKPHVKEKEPNIKKLYQDCLKKTHSPDYCLSIYYAD